MVASKYVPLFFGEWKRSADLIECLALVGFVSSPQRRPSTVVVGKR